MKHEALLRARKNVLDDFLCEGDDEYEIAQKAIDLFLDYLEQDIEGAQEIIITSTNAVEYDTRTISSTFQGDNGTDVRDYEEEE